MDKMKEELLEEVSGGWNVDDLTPQELEEFERLGGLLVDMQIRQRNGEKYNKDEVIAITNQINALDKTFHNN